MKKLSYTLTIIVLAFVFNSCIEECTPSKTIEQDSLKQQIQKKIIVNLDSNNFALTNYSSYQPFSSSPDKSIIRTSAWTISGTRSIARVAFKVDLSAIPANATISNAKLSLYQYERPGEDGFTSRNPSNDFTLYKILESWEESTITWNNQPAVSPSSKVQLAGSGDLNGNYEDIDIINLISDTNGSLLPNYGFLMQLNIEQIYRFISFGSPTCPDITKRPKLEITYTILE